MPHQLNNTAFVCPILYGSNVVIINPSVTTLIRHIDMDKVETVHGGIFTCQRLDLIGNFCIPVHISHHTTNHLFAIQTQEIIIEIFYLLGLSCHESLCDVDCGSFVGCETETVGCGCIFHQSGRNGYSYSSALIGAISFDSEGTCRTLQTLYRTAGNLYFGNISRSQRDVLVIFHIDSHITHSNIFCTICRCDRYHIRNCWLITTTDIIRIVTTTSHCQYSSSKHH